MFGYSVLRAPVRPNPYPLAVVSNPPVAAVPPGADFCPCRGCALWLPGLSSTEVVNGMCVWCWNGDHAHGGGALPNPFFAPPAIQYVSRVRRNPSDVDGACELCGSADHGVLGCPLPAFGGGQSCEVCGQPGHGPLSCPLPAFSGAGMHYGLPARPAFGGCPTCGGFGHGVLACPALDMRPELPNPFFAPPAIQYVSRVSRNPGEGWACGWCSRPSKSGYRLCERCLQGAANPPQRCLDGHHDYDSRTRTCRRRGCGKKLDEVGQGYMLGLEPALPPPTLGSQGTMFGYDEDAEAAHRRELARREAEKRREDPGQRGMFNPLRYEDWTCAVCHLSNAEKDGVRERYSFGAYAGRYHDACWPKSGYRDAVDPSAEFDEMDAGERLDELENPGGTLQDAAEEWAHGLGLKVPARGSPAWKGMYQAWLRMKDRGRNPMGVRVRKGTAGSLAKRLRAAGVPKKTIARELAKLKVRSGVIRKRSSTARRRATRSRTSRGRRRVR